MEKSRKTQKTSGATFPLILGAVPEPVWEHRYTLVFTGTCPETKWWVVKLLKDSFKENILFNFTVLLIYSTPKKLIIIENLKNRISPITSGDLVPKRSAYLPNILWIRAQVLLQDKELVPHPASFPALHPGPGVSPESPPASQRDHFPWRWRHQRNSPGCHWSGLKRSRQGHLEAEVQQKAGGRHKQGDIVPCFHQGELSLQ